MTYVRREWGHTAAGYTDLYREDSRTSCEAR